MYSSSCCEHDVFQYLVCDELAPVVDGTKFPAYAAAPAASRFGSEAAFSGELVRLLRCVHRRPHRSVFTWSVHDAIRVTLYFRCDDR